VISAIHKRDAVHDTTAGFRSGQRSSVWIEEVSATLRVATIDADRTFRSLYSMCP
jgi:hypothetical protein